MPVPRSGAGKVQLTPQELKVAELLLVGKCNKEIAAEMDIAIRTVKQYMHSMYTKFGIWDGYKRIKLAVMLYEQQQGTSTWTDIINKEEQK